jgi:hypothetical protein
MIYFVSMKLNKDGIIFEKRFHYDNEWAYHIF